MRCLSQIFQPIITIPKNAKIKNTEITCKSQKLLLECGLVRPTSAGFFTLLPLARRALDKLEAVIQRGMESVGAQKMSLPTLTAAGLWEKTGRLESATELLTVKDRHGKQYILSPTHEEAVADLLADVGPLSYKQLPLLLYQISSKFRDELRPKHGLLRSRQFLMMDAYSVHQSEQCARDGYERVAAAYRDIFRRLGLDVHAVSAPAGDMGGSCSHEWQLRAAAGDDRLALCGRCGLAALGGTECERCGSETELHHSVEVGHTFLLGSRYSDPLQAHFTPSTGPPAPLFMACYGIGISRLLAAGLEALSSETSLRWPRNTAPYSVLIIGPKEGSQQWALGSALASQLQRRLARVPGLARDVLADDRHRLSVGKRLLMADKMGYPYIIVCGRSILDNPPRYEVYRSEPNSAPTPELLTLDGLYALLAGRDDDIEAVGN